jgi:hypothetical protein
MPPTFVPVNQANGAPVQEYGAMQAFSLADVTGQTLVPPNRPAFQTQDRQDMSLVVRVSATGAFNLDYEFSTDGGTTWYVGQQVASSTITADDGTASYTQNAVMNITVGWWWRVNIYNPGGSPITVVGEWRYFSAGG